MDQSHHSTARPCFFWVRQYKALELNEHVGERLTVLSVFSATQFRWIQREAAGERYSWGVDHVYIGEACPGLCGGHGYCTTGPVCICDEGYHGRRAFYPRSHLG